MHILLVEDELDISSNLKIFLESKDYQITVSNTLKNAQANLKYTDYDLMILDITLPDEFLLITSSVSIPIPIK